MKSVLGVNEKPNCLIIDEIDGAPTVISGHKSTTHKNNRIKYVNSFSFSLIAFFLPFVVCQAAINILLATLNRKDGHSGEAAETTTKKKKKKESILLRPIICICNDL